MSLPSSLPSNSAGQQQKDKHRMKTIVLTLVKSEDKVHSVIFKPIGAKPGQPPFVSSVYIMRSALLPGTTEIKLELHQPEGGQDVAYNTKA